MRDTKEEMLPRQMKAGEILYHEKEMVQQISILIKGKMKATGKYGEVELAGGSFLGVVDVAVGSYIYTYTAKEDCVVFSYHYEQGSDLERLLDNNNSGNLINGLVGQTMMMVAYYKGLQKLATDIFRFTKEEYEGYQKLCSGYLMNPEVITQIEELKEYTKEHAIDSKELEYQVHLHQIPTEILKYFYGSSKYITMVQVNKSWECIVSICTGCENAIRYINQVSNVLISKNQYCLFEKLSNMACKIRGQKGDYQIALGKIKRIMDFISQADCINKEDIPVLFGHLKMKLQAGDEVSSETLALTQNYTLQQIQEAKDLFSNATDKLIAYAGMEKEKGERFKQLLTVFGSFQDKFATTDDMRRVRKEINKLYFELYELIFIHTLEEPSKEIVVDLFLDYGFIDEKLLEVSQVLELVNGKRDNDKGDYRIYTAREWLMQIYEGKAEPSKNEFDLDYAGTLREMKKTKQITEAYEREYMSDAKGKVVFEIQNMLQSANKVTNGKILTYCPILFKEALSDSVETLLIQKSAVKKAFEDLKSLDYSLFYRNVLYRDVEHGIEKAFIDKEVLPIIVLMPNVGMQGCMWQETSGVKKDTPARFALPIMTASTLADVVMNVVAKYRWEICKNIQGVYWSDITEKSLTSEYYDYLQFYRKNRDLTATAKDKIKTSLTKARNNFREVFVQDYMTWIRFESEGSTRLNKVAREILLTYCPFSKEIRQKLMLYPAFKDSLGRFEIKKAAKVKKIENSHLSLSRNGGTITPEMEENLNFNKL